MALPFMPEKYPYIKTGKPKIHIGDFCKICLFLSDLCDNLSMPAFSTGDGNCIRFRKGFTGIDPNF
jgi:hypothetical protein